MGRKRQIKICGMTRPEDIDYVNEYRPDLVGFILFFPKSKRHVDLETAVGLKRRLDPAIRSVAVTVSPTIAQVEQIEKVGFDYIQIHGVLTEEVYEQIHIPILRAFNVTDLDAFARYQQRDKIIGYVFDAKNPGSGQTFDWTLLEEIDRGEKLLFLAGGIDASNVQAAIREVDPDGIDVSSAVENPDVNGRCGGKNKEKIKEIIRMVRDEQ